MRRSALEIAQSRVDEAPDNRAAMPQSAAAKDLFTALFGPSVRMTYAEENGRTLGRKDTRNWVPISLAPPQPLKKKAHRAGR